VIRNALTEILNANEVIKTKMFSFGYNTQGHSDHWLVFYDEIKDKCANIDLASFSLFCEFNYNLENFM